MGCLDVAGVAPHVVEQFDGSETEMTLGRDGGKKKRYRREDGHTYGNMMDPSWQGVSTYGVGKKKDEKSSGFVS